MLLADGFAAACFAKIAQVRSPLTTAHDFVEGLRVEGMPMYSERRP
jgi:hypothetical protein